MAQKFGRVLVVVVSCLVLSACNCASACTKTGGGLLGGGVLYCLFNDCA